MTRSNHAPGAPGATPHWAGAAKTGVGTAIGADSSVWFTLSRGIVTEVMYPYVDHPCSRGMGFIVTDRQELFSDELRDTENTVEYIAEGVPAFHLKNRCRQGRYEIEKTVLADPRRSALLHDTRFSPLQGELEDYALFLLLSPHMGDEGRHNHAWLGDFKGIPMLFAKRADQTLAVATTCPWLRRSVGFVGASDGRLDLEQHKVLKWQYDRADDGNVMLAAEIDLVATEGRFVIALGFGRDEFDAGHRARATLLQGFESARDHYVENWRKWHKTLRPIIRSHSHAQDMCLISAVVMRTHESKEFPGGIIASLAVPWGAAQSDRAEGYHLVWPRNMIQTVGGLLAVKGHEDARRVLFYLQVTQEADGHWPQNMFLDGQPNWNGVQLDETAFVILLVDLALREDALDEEDANRFWDMIRRAASYLVIHGPVTPLDRWEEQSGYFASTIPVEIAALLIASQMAEKQGETKMAKFLRETADAWNAEIERLLYVTDTELAREVGVEGYYVRFAAADQRRHDTAAAGEVDLANHPPGAGHMELRNIVSPDALALVRFGLRAANDPRIENTVRVIDHLLRVETPHGVGWHRYSNDGYGEHADGSPYRKHGIGRVWPLLSGERGHYELAAGRRDLAEKMVESMEGFANESGYISEQVWDSPDIPEHNLHFGRPSGSAMPLVSAHAEYVKLRRSLEVGKLFDLPPQTEERYVKQCNVCRRVYWRFEQPCIAIEVGSTLRLEARAAAEIEWSFDNWRTLSTTATVDSHFGIHYVDLPTESLAAGDVARFTFHWIEADHWEGRNFEVSIKPAAGKREKAVRGKRLSQDGAQTGKSGGQRANRSRARH